MMPTLQTTLPDPSRKPLIICLIISAITIFLFFTYQPFQQIERNRLNMEKETGRNGKHANPDAQKSAEEQYQQVRSDLQKLKSKTNKTPEDKQIQKQLEKEMKHWRNKKDWGGEHHSQKNKGN